MITASAIVRERAAQARLALEDCAENAPWDADYCKQAVAENEALADLLDALAPLGRPETPIGADLLVIRRAFLALDAALNRSEGA